MTTRLELKYYRDLKKYRWDLFDEEGLIAKHDAYEIHKIVESKCNEGWKIMLDDIILFVDKYDYKETC